LIYFSLGIYNIDKCQRVSFEKSRLHLLHEVLQNPLFLLFGLSEVLVMSISFRPQKTSVPTGKARPFNAVHREGTLLTHDATPHATNFNPFTKNQHLAAAEDNEFAKEAHPFTKKCHSPGEDLHSFAGDKALFAGEGFSLAADGRSMAAERHPFA
jgi:hypothetical protein